MIEFNPDFEDLLIAMADAEVEFLVVGGWAMAHHGHGRGTDDLDVWVRSTAENSQRVYLALAQFGAPLSAHGIHQGTFAEEGVGYRFGVKPQLAEVLTSISGVTFDDAWPERRSFELEGRTIPVIGRRVLRQNKVAAGRPQDLADVAWLDANPGER